MKDKHITIYTILMTTKYESAGFGIPDLGDSRIVGFYERLEDAVSAPFPAYVAFFALIKKSIILLSINAPAYLFDKR